MYQEPKTPQEIIAHHIAGLVLDEPGTRAWKDFMGEAADVVRDIGLAGYVIIRDRTDPEGGVPGRRL